MESVPEKFKPSLPWVITVKEWQHNPMVDFRKPVAAPSEPVESSNALFYAGWRKRKVQVDDPMSELEI